jgi:hypothetical protein
VTRKEIINAFWTGVLLIVLGFLWWLSAKYS